LKANPEREVKAITKLLEQKNSRSVNVFFVSSYLPRKCGIATFTHDLTHAIGNEIGHSHYRITAINNRAEGYDYPDEVAFEIQQNRIGDYRLAADYVNYSDADIVCLQHEFGIFGGPEGTFINHFLGNLKKPVITTFHTVMNAPSDEYRRALQDTAELSHGVVVMSEQSIETLKTVYGIPEEKILFIHHGVPDVPFVDPNYHKDKFQVEGKFVLLTFGLLNPNKGIETVIKALPDVIKKFPNIAYIILGATHPEIKKCHGEEYRISLQRRVIRLGLEKHVFFYDRFVNFEELCEFIGACDIYITPYLSRDQSTSGTLAYALGMGKAVISTPYSYASEMLQDGRGILMEFGDFRGLARFITQSVENEVTRHQMRKKAYEFGRNMIWSRVAEDYLNAFERILGTFHARHDSDPFQFRKIQQEPLPEINLNQIFHLTDDTGIIQHSFYGIPDRRFGYSTDDAAIGLIVTLRAYSQLKDESFLNLSNVYLSFLRYAQLDTGQFQHKMNYGRQFTDDDWNEETLGKAIWSLGCAVYLAPKEGFRNLAREIFERAILDINLVKPLPKAYAIVGLASFLKKYVGATGVKKLLQTIADELAESISKNDSGPVILNKMEYGNAKIIHALLVADQKLGNPVYRNLALRSLDDLTQTSLKGDYFDFSSPVKAPEEESIERPLDAGFMVEACILAFEITGEIRYQDLARIAFDWYLGRNRLGTNLFDFSTGACYDGIGPHGVNLNQGAESALAFLLANLAVSEQLILHPLLTNVSSHVTTITRTDLASEDLPQEHIGSVSKESTNETGRS
jgi:glycosyltransferase involved in cell wall biosynthesis